MTPLTAVETAKAIRVALRAAFPGVGFKVLKHRGSDSTSLSAKWVDGPCLTDVENVLSAFEGNPDYLITGIYTDRYFSGETYENIYQQIAYRNPDLPILRDGYPNKHLPVEDMRSLDTDIYDIKGAVSIHEAAYQIALQHPNPKELSFS